MKKTLLILFTLFISVSSYSQTCIGVTGGLSAAKTNINEQTEMSFTGADPFKVTRVVNGYYGFILSNDLGTKGRIHLQSGFNVVTKGYESKAEYPDDISMINITNERTYSIKTFEIPLLLRLVIGKPNVGIDPYLLGGGYLGINRKAHVDYKDEVIDMTTNESLSLIESESDHKPYDQNDLSGSNMFFNSFYLSTQKDLGLMYGGGFAFNLGGPKLFIEAKATRSLKNRSVFMDMNGNVTDPKVGNRVFYLSAGLLIPIFPARGANEKRSDD